MLIFSNNYCWLKKTSNDKVANDDFLRGKPCKGGYSGFRNFHVYFGIKPNESFRLKRNLFELSLPLVHSKKEISSVAPILTLGETGLPRKW